MPLSEQQKEQFLKESMDSRKVILYCSDHNYYGPTKDRKNEIKPKLGCPKCWMVFYWHDIASAPPDKRAERLDELTEVIRNVVQSVEAGTWDFQPYDKPKIDIQKGN